MTTTAQRVPEQLIDQAKRNDVRTLAERYSELRHCAGARELEGPCPKCGGTDRFHCQADWFFCRQCHPKHGDAIEFLRWMRPGLDFVGAVQQLTGGALPAVERTAPPARPARPAQPVQSADWRRGAEDLVARAHARLWTKEGAAGQAYLERRGLDPHVWLAYGVGYDPAVSVPGTEGKQKAPAIVLPWKSRAGAGLYAVRFRFLEPQSGQRLVSHPGSQFAGKLFGSQAMPDFAFMPVPDSHRPVERLRTLVLCEGEINALSVYQVAGETALDVLSIGSESAQLAPGFPAYAARYGLVLVWADKPTVAQRLMAAVPGSHGVHSPNGQDANDLLRADLLGGFLSTVRANAAKDAHALEGLMWNLYDEACTVRGVDRGTAAVCMELGRKLGKDLRLAEPETGRWVAEHTLMCRAS